MNGPLVKLIVPFKDIEETTLTQKHVSKLMENKIKFTIKLISCN